MEGGSLDLLALEFRAGIIEVEQNRTLIEFANEKVWTFGMCHLCGGDKNISVCSSEQKKKHGKDHPSQRSGEKNHRQGKAAHRWKDGIEVRNRLTTERR